MYIINALLCGIITVHAINIQAINIQAALRRTNTSTQGGLLNTVIFEFFNFFDPVFDFFCSGMKFFKLAAFHIYGGMNIGIKCYSNICMTQHFAQRFYIDA